MIRTSPLLKAAADSDAFDLLIKTEYTARAYAWDTPPLTSPGVCLQHRRQFAKIGQLRGPECERISSSCVSLRVRNSTNLIAGARWVDYRDTARSNPPNVATRRSSSARKADNARGVAERRVRVTTLWARQMHCTEARNAVVWCGSGTWAHESGHSGPNLTLRSKERGSNSAVECQLPKLDAGGSSPLSRSMFSISYAAIRLFHRTHFSR